MVLLTALSFLQSPNDSVLKLADRIELLKAVAFDYVRELDYGSNGYKHKLTARMYVEFDKSWKPLGARYQAKASTFTESFDGISYVNRSESHEPVTDLNPSERTFDSVSILKNSLIGLSAALRAARSEAKAFEAMGSGFRFELVQKEMHGVWPLVNVGYSPRYEVYVDKKSGLPTKIVQYLKDRKDTITTSFLNYDLAPKAPWAERAR